MSSPKSTSKSRSPLGKSKINSDGQPNANPKRSTAKLPKDPTNAMSTLSVSSTDKATQSGTTPNKVKPSKMPARPMPNPFAPKSPARLVPTEAHHSPISSASKTKEKPSLSSDWVIVPPFEPKGFTASGRGKFATSATVDADDGEVDVPLREAGRTQANVSKSGVGSTSNHGSGPSRVHRKPRFKQVIPRAADSQGDGQAGAAVDNASQIKSLLNFVSAEEEVDEEADNETELKIDGLLPRLLSHQSRGVRFMARRERGRKYVRGGILADEMGLGKTIQSIAIILYHPAEPSAPRTTLVVAPLAVLDQWKDEIVQMAPKLKVYQQHGPRRAKTAEELENYDVVVTTYDVVMREHHNNGALFEQTWHRIIADEAHSFRGIDTKISAAMAALKSDGRRWVLTGTPMHNQITDLFGLFRFIGVPNSRTLAEFEENYGGKNIEPLKKQLRTIMLRRTQKVLGSFLPPISMHPTKIKLTPKEWQTYYSYLPSSDRTSSSSDRASSKALVSIVRMRQACDGLLSPDLINLSKNGRSDNDSTDNRSKSDTLASKNEDDAFQSNFIDESDDLAAMLGSLSIKPQRKESFVGDENSKVQEVRRIIKQDTSRKTVVFSSFVTMLHLLKPMLDFEGVRYLLYDGSLNARNRQEILSKFRDEKAGYVVLLCSLKAAAVGLNLTSASQVIMVEPWWNPQIVDQAIKRVHRLGQVCKVDCYELFAGDTLEERIMHIQDAKRKLAKKIVDGGVQLSKKEKEYLLYGDEYNQESQSSSKADLPWATQRVLPKVPKHINNAPKKSATVE